MPPTLTNRELKNKTTGIDILVPEYQIIPGKIVNTVLYHIIVITRLFYFKTRQHKESDLVQFAVAKKYEEVEDLHTKIVAKFPSVNFAPLPRMSLIVTEKVLNERKKFLENLLILIAKTPKLCSSTPVLEFLEVSKISIKQNQLKQNEPEKPKEEPKEQEEEKSEEPERDIFGVTQLKSSDEDSDDDNDEKDLSVVDMKRPPESSKDVALEKDDDDDDDGDHTDGFLKTTGKFSFGSHDVNEGDVSDLFIPEEAKKRDDTKLFVSGDDVDLLNIDDDLDKLLNISKKSGRPQPTPKPRAPPKPDLKPRPTPKPRFAETTSSGDENFLSKPVVPPKPKPRSKAKPETEKKSGQTAKSTSTSEKSDDLQDIFSKPSRKDLFSSVDDDEDLFKPETSENLDVDDITKYIEQNIGKTSHAEVDLFS